MLHAVLRSFDRVNTPRQALARWLHDPRTLAPVEESQNFVYRFCEPQRGAQPGPLRYLRLTHETHRTRELIEAELDFVNYLAASGAEVAAPVQSLSRNFVEVLPTPIGEMYAAVFQAVHGQPVRWDTDAENRAVATHIAIAALRYSLLKFTRNTVIAFDLQEALSFEGETGPYVQYAAVRARKILAKLQDNGEQIPDFAAELAPEAVARQLQSEDFWQMLLAASKADSALESAVQNGEPAHVAKYAFQLAQAFSNFYQKYPIIYEEDREKKVFLLWMTDFFRRQLERTAGILGIRIPAYM